MAALAPTLPLPRLAAKRDDELVARVRAGDDGAVTEVYDRHRSALLRYARRVLGDGRAGLLAEDVVQEVFVKAHATVPLDDALDAPAHGDVPNGGDPFHVLNRRTAVRDMLADIATLPERQREVLLRREVDGASHEQVAAELGITVRASKNLANRARGNLARSADARGAACAQVRDDLLTAFERRRRAGAHAHRHLVTCRDCRRYRAQLTNVRSALRILGPGPIIAPLATLLGGWTRSPCAARSSAPCSVASRSWSRCTTGPATGPAL
jgi:DNA-directed RNA polymerase specialized sigma24 family protein